MRNNSAKVSIKSTHNDEKLEITVVILQSFARRVKPLQPQSKLLDFCHPSN